MTPSRSHSSRSRALAVIFAAALSCFATLASPAHGDEPAPAVPAASDTSPEESAMRSSLLHASRDNLGAWLVCDHYKQNSTGVPDSDLSLCAKMEDLRKSDLELRRQRDQAKSEKDSLGLGVTFMVLLLPQAGVDDADLRKWDSLNRKVAQLNAQIAANERKHLRYARQFMLDADADPARSAPSTSVAVTPPRPAAVGAAGPDRRPAVLSGTAAAPAPTR